MVTGCGIGVGVYGPTSIWGGQTEFCPNGFGGGGVVAEIVRDPYSVGGGSTINFRPLPERTRFGGGGG